MRVCSKCGKPNDFYGEGYSQCKDCIDYSREYHKRQDVRLRERKRIQSKEFRAYRSRWTRENRGLCNAKAQRRRANKLNQTPDNVDHSKIKQIYEYAAKLNDMCGYAAYHVDHITPLSRGGLHVHTNLQVIPAKYNSEKGTSLSDIQGIRYNDIKDIIL